MLRNQTNTRPRCLSVAEVMCPLIRDAAAASLCLWLRRVRGRTSKRVCFTTDRPPTPDLLPSLCTCQRQSHFLQYWIFKPCSRPSLETAMPVCLWRPLSRRNDEKHPRLETVLFTCRCFTRPVFSRRRRQSGESWRRLAYVRNASV